ncbi:MAG: hypothetical protein M3R24_12690 [Chloroflexota bacterium]|nr:hypothetical protein [Chloroflexota bacterium]
MNQQPSSIEVYEPISSENNGGRAALVHALARLIVRQACDVVGQEDMHQQRKAG